VIRMLTVRHASIAGIGIILTVGALAVPASAATPTIPDEPFTGTSTLADDWLVGGLNWTPCLTAATTSAAASVPACAGGPIDPVGDGALRLTQAVVQGGYAILTTPIDTSLGLQIEFDMFQYDTQSPGDGMAFFLIDGAASPTQGGTFGGGLGYASGHYFGNTPGIVGGYVGVGFDTYGAFSDPSTGDNGAGPGAFTPNAIVVRGDQASDYALISSQVAAGPLAVPAATARIDALRHVVVTISKLNVMSVDVDYGAGLVPEVSGIDLDTVNGVGSLPSSLKLGFTGSTGGAYSIHEIRNFGIQTLAPDLALSATAGQVDPTSRNATVSLDVTNAATTGATDGIITVTSTLPAGVVPVTADGAGWTCGIVAQLVTCTRPGIGVDRLQAGESAPPIELLVHLAGSATGSIAVSATVSVLDDSNAANDTGSAQLATLALAATGTQTAWWMPAAAAGVVALGLVLLARARRRVAG
jgi:LPXTG-motif cell wall-anchored protein